MKRTVLGTATALFVLAAAGDLRTLAQPSGPPELQPNPAIEELLRKSPEGEKLVELKGYVGPSTAETLRLYPSLDLSRYLEIPRSAIVSSAREGDSATGTVKLHVRGSATVVVATSISAEKMGLASAKASGLGGTLIMGPGCQAECAACVLSALQPPLGADIHCTACIICYAAE